MKKRDHKFLHKLLTLHFASPINLFSYGANSYRGSLLQVNKDIQYYLGLGFIKEIPVNKPKSHSKNIDRTTKDWSTFYCLTLAGAKEINREDEYRQYLIKSLDKLEHESMKIDIARAFLENFPEYDFDFNYKSDFKEIRPDILVKTKNRSTGKKFTFLVEIEHKKEMSRTHREKVLKYDQFIKKGLFEKNGLSSHTKVLIVFNNLMFNGFYRPLYFNSPDYKPVLDTIYKSFDEYIENHKYLSNKYYRFIPFPEFPLIDEPNWRMPNGTKVKIIE
jgi:hypothetical protein